MDRFQELSKIALDELSEVFARMSDENVRELLEEIPKKYTKVHRQKIL